MSSPAAASAPATLREHYRQQYGAFTEDFGQNSWHTAEEQERFLGWLGLDPAAQGLDIGCGAGGPARRLARRTGCQVVGIDVQAEGITAASAAAEREGLAGRAQFARHDADQPLPFPDAAFDAVVCIDAVNHLRARPAVAGEWRRVLKRAGWSKRLRIPRASNPSTLRRRVRSGTPVSRARARADRPKWTIGRRSS